MRTRSLPLVIVSLAAVVGASLLVAGYRPDPKPKAKPEHRTPNTEHRSTRNPALYHFTGKHALASLKLAAVKHDWATAPIGRLVGAIGLRLLDTPYVNHTLDRSADKEFCVVNLQELDCVTFVESTLALARSIKLGQTQPLDVSAQVEGLRYRDGKCDGFPSRLHYLSDWFYDNAKKGLVKDITADLPGAEVLDKKVKLMSSRPKEYTQLRKHPEWIPAIRKDEEAIWTRKLHFVPKDSVADDEQYLQTGDVIAITTSAGILDCAHTGLCYRDADGVLRFLHASQKERKVYLDDQLSAYLSHKKAFTGIMVARPIEPLTTTL